MSHVHWSPIYLHSYRCACIFNYVCTVMSNCLYKSMVGYNSFSSRASFMWNALPAHLKGSEDIRSFSTELLHALNDEKLTISLYPLLFENVFHQ